MPKKTLITHDLDLHTRIRNFFDQHWKGESPDPGYAERLLEAKRPLADLFGLPAPDSGWLIEEQIAPPDAVTLTLRQLAALLVNPYPIDSPPSPVPELPINLKNLTIEGKNPIKIIKLLRKAPVDVQILAFVRLILNRAHPSAPRPDEGKTPDWSIWWPKLGDYLKSFKAQFFISPDPLLLLASGINGNDASCHRPGGQYQYGTFAYASDKITFGAYMRSGSTQGSEYLDPHDACNALRGRCLYWVPYTAVPAFIQGRNYFGFQDNQQRLVRDFIQGRLREVNDLPRGVWSVSDDDIYHDHPNATYMDGSFLKAYWLPEHAPKPGINIGTGICPVCLDHSIDESGCCMSGGGTPCIYCGETFDDGDGYSDRNDNPLCEECYHEHYIYCDHCNEIEPREGSVNTQDGYTLCEYCHERNAHQCEHCGTSWYMEQNANLCNVEIKYGDEVWCEGCRDIHANYCDECGEYFSNDQLDGNNLCEECAIVREEEESDEEC